MANIETLIAAFFAAPRFAVVGAGNDLSKYGALIFAEYRRRGFEVFPVNPSQPLVQGVRSYATLAEIPESVPSVSVVTPPAVTERVVEDAALAGAQIIWMQPGAESARAILRAEELGLDVIAGGPCVLVALARAGTPSSMDAPEPRQDPLP